MRSVIVSMPSGGAKRGTIGKFLPQSTHQFVQFDDWDHPIPVHHTRIKLVHNEKE